MNETVYYIEAITPKQSTENPEGRNQLMIYMQLPLKAAQKKSALERQIYKSQQRPDNNIQATTAEYRLLNQYLNIQGPREIMAIGPQNHLMRQYRPGQFIYQLPE